MLSSKKISSLLIDWGCLLSIVGIWPRFIEPKRLKVSNLRFDIAGLESDSLKIIHLTDLHFHEGVRDHFLNKIVKRVRLEKPDLIVFTGDFICYSKIEERERLQNFLCELSAPLGSFCTFGNHDYASYVSRTFQGHYDIARPINPLVGMFRGLKTLFSKRPPIGKVTDEAKAVPQHRELVELLSATPFTLLENTSVTLPCGLNIVGLGDYALGRFHPEHAFSGYNQNLPGIVLSHNPDTFPSLTRFPGELILSGHTHGEQVHFPAPRFLRNASKKLSRLENEELTRGLIEMHGKRIYVNRGLGGHKPFRLFSPPEIAVFTLRRKR